MKIILPNKTLSTLVISTIVLFTSMNSQAEIYKWTDAKGVTHYSSQKPVKQKIKSENIEDKIRFAAGKYRGSSQEKVHKPSVQTKKNPDGSKKQQELSGPDEKLAQFCKNQRVNLKKLTENFRNVWKEKDGKTTRLNQQQRQKKVKQIKRSIAIECSGV